MGARSAPVTIGGTGMQDGDDNLTLRVAAYEPHSLANGPGVRAVLWVQGCGRRCPGCFNPEFQPREGGRLVPVAEVAAWIGTAAGGRSRIGVEGGRGREDGGGWMPEAGCQRPDAGNRRGTPDRVPGRAAADPETAREARPGVGFGAPDLLGDGAVLAPRAYSGTIEGVTFSGGEPFDQAVAVAAVARAAQAMGLGVLVFTGYPWCELRQGTGAAWADLLAATDLLVAGPYEQDRPGTYPLMASANQELVHLTERYRTAVTQAGGGRRSEFHIAVDGTVRVTGFPRPPIGGGAR